MGDVFWGGDMWWAPGAGVVRGPVKRPNEDKLQALHAFLCRIFDLAWNALKMPQRTFRDAGGPQAAFDMDLDHRYVGGKE